MTTQDEEYIATIDQGTTGTRFILFRKDGTIATRSYKEHKQIYPRPGWVEHSPLAIWDNTKSTIRDALTVSKISPSRIAAIGVTNQRETTVIWDPTTGKPYDNAIVWQCTRTSKICGELEKRGLGALIKEKTGLPVSTYFSGPKIKWMLDNVPAIKEKAKEGRAIFGNMDTWIIWNLTGGPNRGKHLTDYTNASRTMLMDLRHLCWDEEILKTLGIPGEMLPQISPSSDNLAYGCTTKEVTQTEIPITADIGDQQAALVGQTCFNKGQVKNTYGTGCFTLMNTGPKPVRSKHGLVTTCAYGLERNRCVYALEGSVAIAGAAVQWLRDNLRIIKTAQETEAMAKSVAKEGSGGIYFVPAFNGLFAPHWDMYARGLIIGITGYTRREHLVHATLEAICQQTADVLQAMTDDSETEIIELRADGGASTNNYLMQLQANILGTRVSRPTVTETTALGAAYLAGLAAGIWKDLDEVRQNWKTEKTFAPEWDEGKREKKRDEWKKAVKRSRRWADE